MKDYPAIGADPDEVVDFFVERRWHGQDSYLRPHVRQVEENVRMVAGRHWDLWVDVLGRFVDVVKFMSEDEKKWRQRPVFNWTGYWYQVTHAKFTENPPVLSFLPATPDRSDKELAEVIDPIYKYLWDAVHMVDKNDQQMRWVVAAGSGILKSYWDPDAGDMEELIAPAEIPLFDELGRQVGSEVMEVPFAPGESGEFEPNVQSGPGFDLQFGQAATQAAGQIGVDVLSPLEVRSDPSPMPFFQKRWRVQRSVMHVEEVRETYDVTVEPQKDVGGRSHTLNRMLFGLGSIGSSSRRTSVDGDWQKQMEEFVEVYEAWEQPRADAPEGRMVVCIPIAQGDNRVPIDGPNPYDAHFDPYQQDGFIELPDRPFGKSPVEDIAPIQRAYNRGWGQILEARNRLTNPTVVIDAQSGIDQVSGAPGAEIRARFSTNAQPVYYLSPPNLPSDVWRVQQLLREEMQDIGSLRGGSEGRAPTQNASGELVKELRFNDDRFVGPALRRAAFNRARMVEQWQDLLRFGWTEERLIRASGEENTARFLTVKPEFFSGRVNVKPVPESMLPESRGERQKRLDFWVSAQLISPEQYFDLFNHPHLGRAVKPGGVHRSMVESEHAAMMNGVATLPIEPHDDTVHMALHTEFMAAPEFMKLEPEVQQLFAQHMQAHREQQVLKAIRDQSLGIGLQGVGTQQTTAIQVQQAAQAAEALDKQDSPQLQVL